MVPAYLVSLLLLDVFAERGRLLPREADEKPAARLGRVALQQLEHVAARLGHRRHLGDDRQVVDDEGDLVLLVARQVLRVAEEAEARHVRRAVRVVLVHEPVEKVIAALSHQIDIYKYSADHL